MNNDVKSFNNHNESGPTSIGNTCVSNVPSRSECITAITNVENDSSIPDNTFQFNSITNENEPSLVHTKNWSSLTPPPIENTTTMKLSSLASKNGDRGPGTSENKRKNSPHQVKPNTVNRPSNTSKPLYSPFHLLHSSDSNGLLEQTIHVPNDRTSTDFTYQHHRRQPHPSRSRHSSPFYLHTIILFTSIHRTTSKRYEAIQISESIIVIHIHLHLSHQTLPSRNQFSITTLTNPPRKKKIVNI